MLEQAASAHYSSPICHYIVLPGKGSAQLALAVFCFVSLRANLLRLSHRQTCVNGPGLRLQQHPRQPPKATAERGRGRNCGSTQTVNLCYNRLNTSVVSM